MKWSLKLGRFAGIDVFIHFTFVMLIAFLAYLEWNATRNAMEVWINVLFILTIFGCVLLHEFGHALMARRYGIRTRDITLLPIGGVARLERIPEKPLQELWVALAGPAVNIVIAVLLLMVLAAQGRVDVLLNEQAVLSSFMASLLYWNLGMVLFNMLPAFPMDGGRVLRAVLAMMMDYAKATRVAASIGQGMAMLFALAGIVGLYRGMFSPLLLFIALFIWIGAAQEAQAAQMKSSLSGATVSQAMLTQFISLWPAQTLGEVANLLLAGPQQHYPVVEGNRVVGLLTRNDLIAGLSQHGAGMPVSAVMHREFPELAPAEPLEEALQQGRPSNLPILPVVQDGVLVGILALDHVGEFLVIRSALAKPVRRSSAVPPPLPTAVPPPLPPRVPPRITPA